MGKLTISDYMKKNPALKRIAEMLENAFNEIGERIRADLLKAYREHAKSSFENFIKHIKEKSGEIPRDRYGRQQFSNWHMFSDYKGSAHSPWYFWEDMRAVVGNFKLTYKYADQNANEAYERARDSFVRKNMDKMSEVLGDRQDLKNAVLRFEFRGGAFEGNIQIYLEEAYFRGDVSVKYVIRTIPRVTPYFQYPLVFVEAEVKKKQYLRPSEDELRMLLGAKKSAAQEKQEIAVASGVCPMSGQYVPEALLKGLYNRMSVYVRCPSCGAIASVNKQSWKFRNHKTPGAERTGAATKLETAGYCAMSKQKMPAHLVDKIGPVEGYKDPKGLCESCGQMVRLDARSEWIRDKFVDDKGYPTRMKVESASYFKHKLTK